jgi:hypothetical protein
MGSIAKRFRDSSDFTLATELTFISLADDKNHKVIAKLVSFLGFRQTVLFMLAFGGTKVDIPTLDNFTERLVLAKAALEVVKKKRPIVEAARDHKCDLDNLKALCKILRKHILFKQEYNRLYQEADMNIFAKMADLANQTESEEFKEDAS